MVQLVKERLVSFEAVAFLDIVYEVEILPAEK
jgi:hypothetical protein